MFLKNIIEINKVIRKSKANIIHAVSMQSIILALLATIFNYKIRFVAAITGLGTLFITKNIKNK